MQKFDLIGFDADDTLWQNERYYQDAQSRFAQLLSHYHPEEWVRARLLQTETRNLQHFGYGIKAFALSMIETAVELTEGRVTGQDIQRLIDTARQMMNAEVELLPEVSQSISQIGSTHCLALITKGDLLDQQRKVDRSGLSKFFQYIEIVSEKTPAIYAQILAKHKVESGKFIMIGNSLKSDILPVLHLGGSAVYIPHKLTWEHEAAATPARETPGFYPLDGIGELPALLTRLED